MANTIPNVTAPQYTGPLAVVSFPRSGSRTVVKNIAKAVNKKPALGVLHTPEYFGENNYNVKEIVFSHEYVLHGHWHTINDLEDEIKDEIHNNYKIIDIVRHPADIIKSLSKIVGDENVLNIYYDALYKTLKAKKDWDIYKTIIFEEYFT